MHEMSLMKDLMKKIVDVATTNDAKRVVQVNVWLGALSHISADHFREHFVEAATGTIAQDAEVSIHEDKDIRHPRAQDILLTEIQVR